MFKKLLDLTILSCILIVVIAMQHKSFVSPKISNHKQLSVIKTQQKLSYKTNASETQHFIINHGPRDKKEIALTFDADITPVMIDWLHSGKIATYNDTRITNYLIKNNIKATYFLTGMWIELYPNATKQLADNPLFELENHSYSHPSMAGYCFGQPQIPLSQYPYEIEQTQKLIKQYTHKTPKYFRFPGGCYNRADLELVKKEGMITVHWDDVANDGFNNSKEDIIYNVLSEAKPGGIIVMHMGSPASNVPQTFNSLPTIINTLEKRGYKFVTVSELLNQKTDNISYLQTKEKYLRNLYSPISKELPALFYFSNTQNSHLSTYLSER